MKNQRKLFKKFVCVFLIITVFCISFMFTASSISPNDVTKLTLDDLILLIAEENNIPAENISMTKAEDYKTSLFEEELFDLNNSVESSSSHVSLPSAWGASYTACSCSSGVPTMVSLTMSTSMNATYNDCVSSYKTDLRLCHLCNVVFWMSDGYSPFCICHGGLFKTDSLNNPNHYQCKHCLWSGYRYP